MIHLSSLSFSIYLEFKDRKAGFVPLVPLKKLRKTMMVNIFTSVQPKPTQETYPLGW